MTLSISEHYSIVTPESAAHGDYDETGTIDTGTPYSFRELVDYIQRGGFSYPSCYPLNDATDTAHVWLEDGGEDNYITGARTYRTLHFDYYKQPHKAKYWHKALKASGVMK